MLRVIICDDDNEDLNNLKSLVRDILGKMEEKAKIHTFTNAEDISDQLLSSCDIALLDINYSNALFNGMDLARRLRRIRKDAIIIFVTNYPEYAIEGYEVEAFRYILKRDLEREFHSIFRKAIELINSMRKTIKIRVDGEIIDLNLDDILFWEVQQHYITVHVKKDTNGRIVKYSFYAPLSEYEKILETRGFLRIHKSYLVNMKHICKLQCREAVLDNGTTLRVGEKKYSEIKEKYMRWKGWQ